MRRALCITAFALVFAVPLWAQHGGGHGGFGGGHGGGLSGHGGFSGVHTGGGHFSGRMLGSSRGFTHPSRTGFSRGPFLHDSFRNGFRRRFRDRDHERGFRFGFRNNCSGFRCGGWGYPWWGYDPWLGDWWDHSSSYDEDYNRNLAIANQMNEQSLEQQRMLRQEEADGDQDAYARHESARRVVSGDDKPGAAFLPGTVLVFRDQHREEIQNYAIVGRTLWNFAPQHTEKISLAQLDLAATVKVNDDRGVAFSLPAANQIQ